MVAGFLNSRNHSRDSSMFIMQSIWGSGVYWAEKLLLRKSRRAHIRLNPLKSLPITFINSCFVRFKLKQSVSDWYGFPEEAACVSCWYVASRLDFHLKIGETTVLTWTAIIITPACLKLFVSSQTWMWIEAIKINISNSLIEINTRLISKPKKDSKQNVLSSPKFPIVIVLDELSSRSTFV